MISRGHKKDEILKKYTLDQIECFTIAALKNQNKEIQDLIIGVRAAFHADNGKFNEFMRQTKYREPIHHDRKNLKVTPDKINAIQSLFIKAGKK